MPNNKQFKLCILHIGTEKTGTSTIQNFLAVNRQLFQEEGFLYTKSAGTDSQHGFVALIEDQVLYWQFAEDLLNINNSDDLKHYRNSLITNLEKEFVECSNCHTLIISSEHFHSRLQTTEKIKKLRQILDPYVQNFRIVVYFRRQDDLAVSYYSTKVKSGATDPVLFPQHDTNSDYYFNYLAIYNNWAAVFGTDNMIVHEFDRGKFINGDLISDFCTHTGLESKNKIIPQDKNQSLNNDALMYLREVNKKLPRIVNGQINQERTKLLRFLETNYSGKPILATQKEAKKFYSRFHPDNKILNNLLKNNGLPPLFGDDFSQYPEVLDADSNFKKMLTEVSSQIWQSYQNELSKNQKSSMVVKNKSPAGKLKYLLGLIFK